MKKVGRKKNLTSKQKLKQDIGKEQLKQLKIKNPALYKILLRK